MFRLWTRTGVGLRKGALCCLVAVSFPVAVWAQVSPGQTIGTDANAIQSALTAAGYSVRSVQAKSSGSFEVDADFDGHRLEIDINRRGQITEIELDD